jgi:hypothetical protein
VDASTGLDMDVQGTIRDLVPGKTYGNKEFESFVSYCSTKIRNKTLKLLVSEFESFVSYCSTKKQTPWPESASELHRPSNRLFLVKLVPTFAYRGCHVVSVTDPYGHILGFMDRIVVP